MPVNNKLAFYLNASHFGSILKEINDLCKKESSSVKEGLTLLADKWSFISNVQVSAAEFASTDDKAAEICIELSSVGAYCLAHAIDIETRISWHEAALKAAQRLDNPQKIFSATNNLAITLITAKREKEAIKLLKEYLDSPCLLENPDGQAKAYGNLGIAYKNTGEYSKSIKCHKKRLKIARQLKDELGELRALANLGIVHKEIGDYKKALTYHQLRLKIAKKKNRPIEMSRALGDMGITYRHMKNYKKSIKCLNGQLEIAKENSNPVGEGNALWELSKSLFLLGKHQDAIINAKRALKIKERMKDPLAIEIQEALINWRA